MAVTQSDIETWRMVEREIGEMARHLCAQSCGDARRGACGPCGANRDQDWRRDALTEIKKQAK